MNEHLLIGILIGMIITSGTIAVCMIIVSPHDYPIPWQIKAVLVQDKAVYCNAYANYLYPDWDTTYNIIGGGVDADAGNYLCSCGNPYKIGGYKWKVDCNPKQGVI